METLMKISCSDSQVITHEDRVTVLEGIAKNYLSDLTNSLERAKIALMTGSLQPNETHSTLELRVRDLQARVDRLAHDMKSINVL